MSLNKYHSIVAILFIACLFTKSTFGQTNDAKYDSVRRIISTQTDTNKITILILFSQTLSCNDTTQKISFLNEALALAEKSKWDKGICEANNELGNTYFKCMSNYGTAINYFKISLSQSKSSGNLHSQISALESLGISYQLQSQYAKALDCYRELLTLTSDTDKLISTFGNIGSVYSSIGDYPRSLIYYNSSLKVLDEYIRAKKTSDALDTVQLGALLITIGDIYFSMSQYDKALENYNRVLNLKLRTREQKILSIWALIGIGKSYQYKKDIAKAIEYYSKALDYSKQSGQKADEVKALNQLGNVYLEKGDVNKAMEFTQNSLKLAEENTLNDLLPVTYTTLGKIYTMQKSYNDAVLYLQKAIDLCKKTGAIVDEKDAWDVLSNTYEQMKKPQLSLDAYKHFISIRDSVFNIEKNNEVTRIDLQAAFDRQRKEAAAENELRIQRQRIYTYSGFAGLALVVLLSFFIYRNYNQQRKANIVIRKANDTINTEKQKSEMLLLNILPDEVASELKNNGSVHAKLFDHVSVLFTDFVNFTEAGERLSPEELVAELDDCFKAFDSIIGKYSIEKIKTVGDAYLAVSGLPNPCSSHASEIIKAAIEFRDFMITRKRELGERTFAMRIGINSGTVVAGIVGVKKFAYDIWGDTVNTAARMEQYSEPDKINISQATYELIKKEFTCTDRGDIDAKHKGKMRMYFVEGNK